jgi:DNA-binding transcriptional MocR family regulator
MVLLNIDQQSGTPLYRQIIQGIVDLIETGSLQTGEKLPSTRQLADKLGLNRTTTYNAFQELISLGYIESRPGSYTTVRDRTKICSDQHKAQEGLISWPDAANAPSNQLYDIFRTFVPEPDFPVADGVVNFSRMDIDPRLYPVDEFRRCLNRVLIDEGRRLLTYGDFEGYYPLREYVARRLRIHGVSAEAEEIFITNGAQQGLELVLKFLTSPGQKVAIEAPTYSNMIPLLKYYGVDVVEIPMRDDGMDLDCLKRSLEEHRLAFVYTIPNFHNPTGITTSQPHREAMLHLCEEYAVPIVEDGFEEEMKYCGKVVLPIKSMDKNKIVIYLGTFSKVLFPGVRVGWITADRECIRRIMAIKRFGEICGSPVLQAAIDRFCRLGYYDAHVKRMHRIYRRRMLLALKTLEDHMPGNVEWTKPCGGYTIWLKLARTYEDPRELNRLLSEHGVIAAPGEFFFHGDNPRRYLRLAIANLNEEEIERGIVSLGRALHVL